MCVLGKWVWAIGRVGRAIGGFFMDFDGYSYCAGEVWPISQLYRDKPIVRCATGPPDRRRVE